MFLLDGYGRGKNEKDVYTEEKSVITEQERQDQWLHLRAKAGTVDRLKWLKRSSSHETEEGSPGVQQRFPRLLDVNLEVQVQKLTVKISSK